MPRQLLLMVCALGIAMAAPRGARAQALRGKLMDADKNPVSGATVTLKDPAGETIAQGSSDPTGLFHVAAPKAGNYIADIRRIGFAPWVSQPMQLKDLETTEIEVTLSTNPNTVARVVVTARTTREWGRDGWAKRKALGLGVFLTGDQVRAEHTTTVAEAMRSVPGLFVTDRRGPDGEAFPAVGTMIGGRCLVWFLNRQPLQSIPGVSYEFELNQLLGPDQVAGIEVYREYKEMPPEFRQMVEHRLMVEQNSPTARPIDSPVPQRLNASTTPACGAVVVWSYSSW